MRRCDISRARRGASEPGSNGRNKIEKLDKHDLLIYNGLDSLLEYMVAMEQREEMRI